jgi:serine/threonine protein kinase
LSHAAVPSLIAESSDNDDSTTIIQFEQSAGSKSDQPFNLEDTLLENDGRAFGLTGTPAYMSPEQCNGQSATPESDVFSLGLILVEMLSGERALPEKNLLKLLLRLQEPTLARDLSAKVPGAFQDLIARMLATKPEDRPGMNSIAQQIQHME